MVSVCSHHLNYDALEEKHTLQMSEPVKGMIREGGDKGAEVGGLSCKMVRDNSGKMGSL